MSMKDVDERDRVLVVVLLMTTVSVITIVDVIGPLVVDAEPYRG